MNRKEALEIAKVYNLQKEVTYAIDIKGYTPEEALAEWDLL